ncbi:aminoglycoside efflux pump [Klebsiella pneumoniae]|nr:aminoglycoside efflux pump [Klebsiella pneumoniae]
MANFFIDRPIFAWVLAILLCLTGALAILSLPVEQYPDLAPPNVRITANYPGASAQTLENTVTQVIEQNMTGLDNLMYMSSPEQRHRPGDDHPQLYRRYRPG